MSYDLEARVRQCRGIKGKAKVVLLVMASHAHDEDREGVEIAGKTMDIPAGWVWTGQALLAGETEYSKRSVQRGLGELIGREIIKIERQGGMWDGVRLTNIYSLDIDKAEMVSSRDKWKPKVTKMTKEERALAARTRIFERQQKELERRASLEGVAPLAPLMPTAKTGEATDVSPGQKPPAQLATKPAEESSSKSAKAAKSVPYSEAPNVFCEVATAGGTIADLENALGYTIQTKIPRDFKPTSEQWQELWTSLFPKAKLVVTTKTVPSTAAEARGEAKEEPKGLKSSKDSDRLAKYFCEEVMDGRHSGSLKLWSALFFESNAPQEDQRLIDAVISGDWKDFLQSLKTDPAEFMLQHPCEIMANGFYDSGFFTPEYVLQDRATRGGYRPGDDERDLYDERYLHDERDLYS